MSTPEVGRVGLSSYDVIESIDALAKAIQALIEIGKSQSETLEKIERFQGNMQAGLPTILKKIQKKLDDIEEHLEEMEVR